MKTIGDQIVYLSIDIDVLDPGMHLISSDMGTSSAD